MNKLSIVGLELAKSVFQAHGATGDGLALFRKKLRRDHVAVFFAELPRVVIPYLSGPIAGLYMAGAMPPMLMFGRALFYDRGHLVASNACCGRVRPAKQPRMLTVSLS